MYMYAYCKNLVHKVSSCVAKIGCMLGNSVSTTKKCRTGNTESKPGVLKQLHGPAGLCS